MKLLTLLILALGALLASGCASVQKFPDIACARWVHDGNYGATTTHYEATGVTKDDDGTVRISAYTGHVKVMGGYGVSDTIEGLVIKPKSPAPAAAPATPPAPEAPQPPKVPAP